MSTVRTLQFDDSKLAKDRFRSAFLVIINGPVTSVDGQQTPRRSWDEQRADAQILRAFKAISHDEVTAAGTAQEGRRRILNDQGGAVRLTASQFDKLKGWWARIQWAMYDVDEIEDAYEWLMAAPETVE